MIDLTPLDVRKKRGDFGKGLRGYDAQEVDTFLELVAERLEEVVKENMTLRERAERLSEQVNAQTGREKAVQDALVTAQQLREEMRTSAERESELVRKESESEARRMVESAESRAKEILAEAERLLRERNDAVVELERRRARFLTSFRQLLERELEVVQVEEGRSPLQDMPIDLDLLGGRSPREREPELQPEPDPETELTPESDPEEPSAEDLGFFGDPEPEPEGASADAAPPASEGLRMVADDAAQRPAGTADVHEMADAVGDAETESAPTADAGGAAQDEDWLDDILDEEADRADKRRDEGEW